MARARSVLLVDEGWTQTLELASALARGGCAVTVVAANGGTARIRRGGVDWRSVPVIESPEFLRHIDHMITNICFDHVLPLTESALRRLWAARAAWSERIFPAAAAWQRSLVLDKHALIAFMAARGVDVPSPRRWDLGDAQPPALPPPLSPALPLVVKGATGAGGARVHIVETAAELARVRARTRIVRDAWCAQEYIAGPTFLVGGLFHDGRPLRRYAAEKLEQFPPRTGPAIRLRSVAHPALLASAERVFRALAWTGLASADFIRRPGGGFALLEVNPRPWGSIAAAASAGVDLYTPFAALLAGRVPAADLAYAVGDDCAIFPRYLMSPAYRSWRGAARALRDLAGRQGAGWREPRLLWHLLGRLARLPRGEGSARAKAADLDGAIAVPGLADRLLLR